MTLTKVHNELSDYIIVEHNSSSKFIMGWFDGNLYWIMLDYVANNKFIVTENSPEFWEFLTILFKENHFKNCTFLWNSESNTGRDRNKLKITKGEKYFKIKFIQPTDDVHTKPQSTCPVCFHLSSENNAKIAEAFSNFLQKLLTRD